MFRHSRATKTNRSLSLLVYLVWVFPCIHGSLGDEIDTEAWLLRNLITILTTAAKRPHVPRSPEFRALFEKIGISLSSPSSAEGL